LCLDARFAVLPVCLDYPFLIAPSLTFIEKMEFINQLLSQVIKQKKMTMPYDVGIVKYEISTVIMR
jgi:hypothetical protein